MLGIAGVTVLSGASFADVDAKEEFSASVANKSAVEFSSSAVHLLSFSRLTSLIWILLALSFLQLFLREKL